jgi:hypothetical protein
MRATWSRSVRMVTGRRAATAKRSSPVIPTAGERISPARSRHIARTTSSSDADVCRVPATGTATASRSVAVTLPGVDDSLEIYENMAKALAVLTAWNESGDGDLSLVEQTTMGYLDSQSDPDAKLREAINLISGLVSLGGRMLLQLAHNLELSEDELLHIMGQGIAYGS